MSINVPSEAQMARLPKNVLDMIQALKCRLDEARAEINLLKGNTPSLINVESWDLETPARPLGDYANISFESPGKKDKITVRSLMDNEGIRVSGYTGTIVVKPVASNVVEISIG